MIGQRSDSTLRSPAPIPGSPGPWSCPADLSTWIGRGPLFEVVHQAAARSCGDSWLNLVSDQAAREGTDNLLVLVSYCYMQGIYHSIDVIRRLDADEHLAPIRGQLGIRAEQVRRFRREHRRSLTDCLTHALVAIWRMRHPAELEPVLTGNLLHNRINFRFLEPFYLQAQDRVDRAVVLDSMALDY